jgi:hypothetical protein
MTSGSWPQDCEISRSTEFRTGTLIRIYSSWYRNRRHVFRMPALATSPYSRFMFICHYNIVFISRTRETAPVDTCAANWTYSFGSVCRDPNLCLPAVCSYWTGLSVKTLVRVQKLRTATPCVRHTSINITWLTVVSCSRCKWNEVKFLGTKVPCTLGWPYTEGYLIVLCLFHLVCIVYCVCFNLFCNVSVCVCGGVLVIRALVFTVFCIVCTVFLYCFVYVYLFLFVLCVLV